jgi:hypothetical protein
MSFHLAQSNWQRARNAVTGLAMGALALAGAVSAATAQQQIALTPQQCSQAQDIAYSLMKKYKISPRLAASFRNFRLSNCDMKTVFERDTDTDEKAFGEFRLRLIALRTADAGKPQVLAKH